MIVDLSHILHSGLQVYPGDPEVEIIQALNVENDYVNVLSVHMGSQSGTHIDSPYHVFTDGKKLSEIPLESFIGPGVVIDATGLNDRQEIPSERFTAIDVMHASIALIRTDW